MRCIDADKLMVKPVGNGAFLVTKEAIMNARTFEAEPVKLGHWGRYRMDIAEHPYHCSYCGWSNYHIDRYVEEFKFCPECGTKMIEVKK